MRRIKLTPLLDYIKNNILLLDGATGTELQKRGLSPGVCPETWAIANEDKLIEVQKSYIDAGSKAILSFTFGANRVKLEGFAINDVYGINKKLAEISVKAAAAKAFVGGNVGSTGRFLEPAGDMELDEAIDIFKEQIRGLKDGGADFIAIETMIDAAEARAAVIAAKETCNLPVCASITFDKNARTLTGASPTDAAIALIAAGADIIGVNCSTGPEDMVKVVEEYKKVSTVPIYVKPNAGIPRIENGRTVFSLGAEEFSENIAPLVLNGANLIGGCCGTDAGYIKGIAENIKGVKPLPAERKSIKALSCASNTVFLDKPAVIGKGLDAEENNEYKELILKGDYESVYDIADIEKQNGADIVQINADGFDGKTAVIKTAQAAAFSAKLPAAVKSKNADTIEGFLRSYTGRALINACGADKEEQRKIFVSVKKYGALVLIIPGNKEDAISAGLTGADIVLLAHDIKTVREYGGENLLCAVRLNGASNESLLKEPGVSLIIADLADENTRRIITNIKNN